MKKLTWLWVFLFFLVACQGGDAGEPNPAASTVRPTPSSEPTDEPETELTLNLNEPFALSAGKSVVVAGTELRLTFTKVVEDSRCPTEVTCVWAGQAVIEIMVQMGESAPQSITFSTNPISTELHDTIELSGYTIHLQSLDPYPQSSDTPIPFEDYQAILVVSQP
ncbi:MAG: hypothetical protein KJ063_16560 [Anaerolineae bacterium]|nr:hypothetical protein [Anaerolineae bacterium]